jgi:DNA-binding winged helix-turn-helix (wHTH) protein/TolB-like protein
MSVVYEFGAFRIDMRKRQLFRGSEPVQLTAKAFDTLAALISQRGEIVPKSALMEAVWPDTAVEENNLTQQISALRKAFGERASDHKFIVTVPGRGYCFVAQISEKASEEESYAAVAANPKRISTFSSTIFGSGLAIAYIMLIVLPPFYVRWHAEAHGVKPQSIAILQFRSTGLGDELLGMGIRDTLRAKLGSIEDVEVRPEMLDAAEPDIVDAGRQMHVDVVVTGSIQRDNDRVRVAVEMVDVSNERIVWGNTFDNDETDAFELQDSIASAVLSALRRPRLSGEIRYRELPDRNAQNLFDRARLLTLKNWTAVSA